MLTHIEALDEINRTVNEPMSTVRLYISGCLLMAIITIVAVVTLAIVRPESGSTISIILGISTPITLGLLGAALQGIHKGVNGRFSQLLISTAATAEIEARGDVIRELYRRLSAIQPGTPAHESLESQIRGETLKFFGTWERRSPNHSAPDQPTVKPE